MIPFLGWPPCRRHGRGFRRATCGPLLRVAGNASSLESLPRRSVPQTAFCTSRQALLCSASRDRRVTASASGLQSRRSSVESAYDTRSRSCLRCVWLCARGQWAPLDADMLELIDRHHVWWRLLLLAEPFCSNPCSRKPAPSTSSAKSGRCSQIFPSRGLVEDLVLPSCSCRS